jgi:thiol-disulfide isomerase/thioredoxin
MALISRRGILAAGGTLAAGLAASKPHAQTLQIQTSSDLRRALSRIDPPEVLPDVAFLDAGGTEHHLSEFRGRGMVVNLWATWCAPCVAEMPSLVTLAKTLAPQDIAVMPLSSDRGGAPVVQAWFNEHGITALPVLLDPKGALARAWQARGIPTTVIVNRQGLGCARLEGSAQWDSPAAARTIRELIGT